MRNTNTHPHTDAATLLSDRLRSAGYSVEQDVGHFGKSGRAYRIDMIAKHETPLAATTLLAWCKDSRIEKRDVKKWMKAWNDLGYGRMVIATTADIQPKAVKMADMHGIRWFDGNDLKQWHGAGRHDYGHVVYLKFRMDDNEIESYAKKNVERKPRKLRIIPQGTKVEVKEKLPFHYPCYEATIAYVTNYAAGLFRKKSTKRRVRIKVTVDARTGRLVIFGERQIMYGFGIGPAEMKILRAAGNTVTEETQKKSGLAIESAGQAMRRLEERGTITTVRRSPPGMQGERTVPQKTQIHNRMRFQAREPRQNRGESDGAAGHGAAGGGSRDTAGAWRFRGEDRLGPRPALPGQARCGRHKQCDVHKRRNKGASARRGDDQVHARRAT